MRAEHELLICIARKALDECLRDRLRNLIQQNIDWDYLLQAASDNRLLPLLSTHLVTTARDLVPKAILEKLRTESLDNSRRTLYLTRELLRVLRLFSKNHIRALAFKGPILAATLYGDVGLRQAGDLDILIPKEQFEAAKHLLQDNGYLMLPQLTSAQQTSHLRFHCEIQFLRRDQSNVVDLHWGLAPKSFPFSLSFEDLWARREGIGLADQSIETFSREDLVLYLCVHGAKHYWSRLEWLASVSELLRSTPNVDWPFVLRQSRETKSERMLYVALLLARSLFAVVLPGNVGELLDGSKSLRKCALGLEEKFFQDTPRVPTQTEMFRWNLQFMDRRREAVISLLRSVLVPTISDWESLTLPVALYPLYYLLRPFRLLRKHSAP